ncbi:MAG: hypothetical protein ABJZ55_13455 [Fuerstiella sp.]
MRWKFQDPANIAESSKRQKLINRIDRWWDAFQQRSDDLDAMFQGAEDWDVVQWMESQLLDIHPELSWEFRPSSTKSKHELVISPDQNPSLVELARQVLHRAPEVANWKFDLFRKAVSVEDCLQRTLDATGIDLSNTTVSVHEGQASQIDFVFYFDRLPADDDVLFEAMLIATELLLGEQQMMSWAGTFDAIDTLPDDTGSDTSLDGDRRRTENVGEDSASISESAANMRFVRLAQVPQAFRLTQDTITDRLENESYVNRIDQLQWAAFKLKPSEAIDYARRDDLMTAMTCDPELTAATFEAQAFASERFSRTGETFCYVKVDERGAVDSGFAEREDMEEAIRSTLESQELGCLVGGGTGLRYTYLELVLTEVDDALLAIRETLQEGQVSRRSWVLFHDATLQNEWFPIYEGAAGPFVSEDEADKV